MTDIEGLLTYLDRVGEHQAMAVAQETVKETKRILRPGYGYRTGKLKRGYKAIKTPAGAAVVQTDPARVGKRPIWSYVEFGTRKMRARPHIRPALEIVRARFARRRKGR